MRLEVAGRGQQAQRPACRRRALRSDRGSSRASATGPACRELLGIEFELARRRARTAGRLSCAMWIGPPANSLLGIGLRGRPGRAPEQLAARPAASCVKTGRSRPMRCASACATSKFERASPLRLAPPRGPIASSRRRRRGRDPRSRDRSRPAARCRRSFAVSVRKGSCTTVNRSSRASPLRTLCDLGAGHRRIVGRDVERADRRVLHVRAALRPAADD